MPSGVSRRCDLSRRRRAHGAPRRHRAKRRLLQAVTDIRALSWRIGGSNPRPSACKTEGRSLIQWLRLALLATNLRSLDGKAWAFDLPAGTSRITLGD